MLAVCYLTGVVVGRGLSSNGTENLHKFYPTHLVPEWCLNSCIVCSNFHNTAYLGSLHQTSKIVR